jgi:hypothetical protein
MPFRRVAETKAESAASIARLESIVAEIERSLDVIEAKLKSCRTMRMALSLRERTRRTLQ